MFMKPQVFVKSFYLHGEKDLLEMAGKTFHFSNFFLQLVSYGDVDSLEKNIYKFIADM